MGNYLFIQLLKTYFFIMPGLWRNTVCQTESTSTCIIRTPVILAWRQIVSTLTQTRTNFINRSGRGRLSTTCSGGLSRDWTSVVISDQFSSGDGGGGGFGGGGTALEQPIGKVTVSTSNFVRCSTCICRTRADENTSGCVSHPGCGDGDWGSSNQPSTA